MAALPRSIVAGSILLCLSLGAGVMRAAEVWNEATSDHFQLYTSNKKEQALRLLRRLETTRQVLQQVIGADNIIPSGRDYASRVTVIAFRSDSDFSDYRSNTAATAYYLEGAGRSYIVLGAAFPNDYGVAVHEYAHHLLHQRYGRLPAWLDEGLAEVYSSVQEKNGELRVGLPLDDRLTSLEGDGLLFDLASLFEVKPDSFANLRHGQSRARFYSESWLLTHMLRFSPAYSSGFNGFLERVAAGSSSERALLDIYELPVARVQQDLKQYLKKDRFSAEIVSLKSSNAHRSEVLVKTADATEVRTTLADLLIALGRFKKAETISHGLQ